MVGGPGHLEQLSRPVVLGRPGKLLRIDDVAAERSIGLSSSDGEVPPGSGRTEQRWLVTDGSGPGGFGSAVTIFEVSGRLSSHSVWPRDMDVPHAAYHDETCCRIARRTKGSEQRQC